MINSYTISGLKSLKDLPKLKTAQFTLNSRTFPSKRKTVNLLKEVPHDKTDIIIHYDYIYVISRFGMMSDEVQNAIIGEIVDIMNYSKTDERIKGIIMHTDFGLRKEVYKSNSCKDLIPTIYNRSLWDVSKILDMSNSLETFTFQNIDKFYHKFMECWGSQEIPLKIYLENTTKVGPSEQGSFDSIVSYLDAHTDQCNLFGVCFDTEHYFAVSGEYKLRDIISKVNGKSLIVHLNTVPQGVEQKSLKDRHSETTVFECSYKDVETYISYVNMLEGLNIPYVREVHEETMYREKTI